MKKRKCFSPGILKNVSNILGDTNNGLTGSEIHRFLLQANIADINPEMTKRTRLYNAFVGFQNEKQCSNHILNFINIKSLPFYNVKKVEIFYHIYFLTSTLFSISLSFFKMYSFSDFIILFSSSN